MNLWQIIEGQSHTWPYFFARGLDEDPGAGYPTLLREATAALGREQRDHLNTLRSRPTTTVARLTPPDFSVGAPAWLPGGDLLVSVDNPLDRPRLYRLSADNDFTETRAGARAGNIRAHGDLVVYHEYNWRSFSHARIGERTIGHRWVQPDAIATSGSGTVVAAIEFAGGGVQHLVCETLPSSDESSSTDAATILPTNGVPWSPAFRDTGSRLQLSWVETDNAGSRLVLGGEPGGSAAAERSVLLERRGRILHPVWSDDGRYLYFCCDVTGVANAYRLEMNGNTPGDVLPITNTIGGIIACVPSPDGRTLAVVEHDHQGPFVGKIPNDPAQWVKEIPTVEPTWPAPRESNSAVMRRGGAQSAMGSSGEGVRPLPAPATGDLPEVEPYGGIREIRPLFWSPTTLPSPGGGIGVSGFASDPLLTHTLAAGVGAGPIDGGLVGFLGYINTASRLHWGDRAARSATSAIRSSTSAAESSTTRSESRTSRSAWAAD